MKHILNNRGFTFFEIVLVIIVLAILINITLIVYPSFQVRTQLDLESHELIENIRNVRFKSMMGENNSQFGIHLENDKYTIFEGSSYSEPIGQNDEVIELSNRIEITDVFLNNSTDNIVFQKGNGNTSNNGSLTVKIRDQDDGIVININSIGNVEWTRF